MLGDAAAQSDNRVHDAEDENSPADDRLVFTEVNPTRELNTAAGLAAASRVLREHNPDLAKRALQAAVELFETAHAAGSAKIDATAFAIAELYLATKKPAYLELLASLEAEVIASIDETGWLIGRLVPHLEKDFAERLSAAVAGYQETVRDRGTKTPYGVPYEPYIWGAGWGIQAFGVSQYFFHDAWPEHATLDVMLDALNFILGVHPGENTMSFASGVGANSALVAYGVNRADWSFIPGGVISGTNLIRPDLPELKTWPFFWQQTEYVMGGGATNFMFLVLAADALYSASPD
jgi:predicted transcriptional regulator